jgi:TP901 family phage tail tape measure protein
VSEAQVTLKIFADPSGVTPGIDRAKREVEGLKAAGRDAAGGLDAMGNSGKRAGKSIADGAGQAGGALQQVNGALSEQLAGLTDIRTITLAATTALAGLATGASVVAAGYEKAIAQVSTLLSDTSGIDGLSASVRALNREFGGGAALQAQGLADIIGAGFEDAAQSVDILRDANRLAIGGLTDVKTAADGLTTVMNAYGASVGNSASVADAFFTSALAGKTTIEQLASSIGSVAPIAAQTGVSLDQVLAATATLTRGGVATSTAMDGIRAAISSIIKPSSEAAKLAEELGLEFNAAALQSQGLAGFLQTVADKTGGSAEKMAVLFGGVEALAPVLTLTGAGAQGFARDLEAMANKAGATEGAVTKMTDTVSFQAGRLAAAVEDIMIGVGQSINEGFGPALKVIADALPEFAAVWSDTFSRAAESLQQLTADGNSLAGMYRNYVESVLDATGDVVGNIVAGFAVLPLTLGAVFTAIIAAGDLAWISLKTGAERLSLDLQSLWVAIKAAAVRAFGELAIDAAGQIDRLLFAVRDNTAALGAAFSAISPAAGAAFRAASAELGNYAGLQDQVREGVAKTAAALADQAAELGKLTQQSFDNRAALIAGSRAALDAAVAEQQAAVSRLSAVQKVNTAVAAGVALATQATAATNANTLATRASAEALRAQAVAAGQAGIGIGNAAVDVAAFATATASASASGEQLASDAEADARRWADYWDGATGAVSQAFGDFVASGMKSFSDFRDSLKRIAQQIISDLVAQFAKPIVMNLVASFGGGGGAGGLLQMLAGGGQGGGGNLLSSLFGGGGAAGAAGASGGGTGMLGGVLGGIGGVLGGFSAGLGVAGSAGIAAAGQFGVASLAAGNLAVGLGSLAGALGPVALALAAINAIAGGRLFGTSYKTNAAGAQFDFGEGGASGFNFQEQSRRRSLFRGTARRTVTEALGEDAQSQIDAVFRAVGDAMAAAAGQLGIDVPARITASFRATTDSKGNLISEVGTILGRQYNETFEIFARRIAAENVIGVLDAALDGEAGRIAEAWRGSADTLADGAQFLLTAATDMRGGFRLLGDASLTGVAELVQRLAGDGESLTAAYQRIAGATRLLEEAVSLSGVTLDMTREQFVEFAAGIAEAAGGLERAQALWTSYFSAFYTEQERGIVALQQATARASGLAGGLGLDLGSFTGQGGAAAFRTLFETQLPTLSAEAVVQWLQFADALGLVLDLQGRYTDAVLETAETIADFMGGIGTALAEFAPAATLQQQLEAQRAANAKLIARAIELGASEEQLAQVRELGDRRISAIIDSVQQQSAVLTGALRRLGIAATGTAEDIALAAAGLSDDFGSLFDQFLGSFYDDAERAAFQAAQAQQQLTQALQAAGLSTEDLISRQQLRLQIEAALAAGNYTLAESLLRVASAMNQVDAAAGNAANSTQALINNGNGNPFGAGGGGSLIGGGGDGPAGGLANDIEAIRRALRDWLTSLTTGELSPERPRDQLRRAQADYQRLLTLAQGGDADALRQLQGASELVLRLGRQVFGSGAGYTALYNQILAQVGGLVGFTAGGVSGPGGGGRPGDLPGVNGLESAATSAAAALQSFALRLGLPTGGLSTGFDSLPNPGPVPAWIGSDQGIAATPIVAELRASRQASADEGARLRRELADLRAEMAQMKQAQERTARAAERSNDLRR